jgi:hypothetical protein
MSSQLRTPLRAGAAALAALVWAGVAGCGGTDDEAGAASPSTPPTTAAATPAGPVYKLPKGLCTAVDEGPLADLFPTDGGQPVADAGGLCATSRSSKQMAVSFSVNAELLPNERAARAYLDTGRRLAKSPPTDIGGAGSGAYWMGDDNQVKLVTYHGNLALDITVAVVNDAHRLPAGLPERLARVADGTFARLEP